MISPARSILPSPSNVPLAEKIPVSVTRMSSPFFSHRRSPKRRFVLTPPDDASLQSLAESIRLHILSLFGNVQPIFKALAVSDSVYLHDLVGYFTQHRVACTLSQLHCLLQPFMSAPASITLPEFQKYESEAESSVDLRLP